MKKNEVFAEQAKKIADVLQEKYAITEDDVIKIHAFMDSLKWAAEKLNITVGCRFGKKRKYDENVIEIIRIPNNNWVIEIREPKYIAVNGTSENINTAIESAISLIPYLTIQDKTKEDLGKDKLSILKKYKANLKNYETMVKDSPEVRHDLNALALKLFMLDNGRVDKYLSLEEDKVEL